MAAALAPKKFDRSLIEGPLAPAVWRLAWPTMLQNLVAGLQGVVDHALVGNLLGFAANAGIGVAWQIFLVVIVFMASLFTGQAVLVARFAGAGDHDKVNRVVYQAFITSVGMYAVLALIGYFAAPFLLTLVNAAPEVRAQALPFLRINFVFSIGMLLFFMLSAALRAAGDARTPLRLGITMTVLNLVLNLLLIPKFGTAGSAMGTAIAAAAVSGYALWLLFSGRLVIRFTREQCTGPDWAVIRSLFRFGLPTGVQGIAMNIAGVLLLRFIGGLEFSAAAQAAYTIGYTELFSMITWTSVGLMGAAATIAGQNLGAGKPERALQGVYAAARVGLLVAGYRRGDVHPHPQSTARGVRRRRRPRRRHRPPAPALPRPLGLLHQRRAHLHRRPPGHRRHPQPALHHPGVADRRADRDVHDHPEPAAARSRPTSGWPSCSATSPAACCRSCASARASGAPSRWSWSRPAGSSVVAPTRVRTQAARSTGTSGSRRSPGWSGSGTSVSAGGRCC